MFVGFLVFLGFFPGGSVRENRGYISAGSATRKGIPDLQRKVSHVEVGGAKRTADKFSLADDAANLEKCRFGLGILFQASRSTLTITEAQTNLNIALTKF